MNNLRKFETEAEYTAATLSYPSVSWISPNNVVGVYDIVNDVFYSSATQGYYFVASA